MDIVTHALAGAVVASPFVGEHPVAAGAFALASTVPDLDALSRLFGKRAFLAHHQTWTHSIAFAGVAAAATGLAASALGVHEPFLTAAVFAGLCFHALLDLTNTYGIRILFPFTRRRFCLEWLFFIDTTVTAITIGAFALVVLQWRPAAGPGPVPAVAWAAAMVAYLALKLVLRHRAVGDAPEGTLALLPSAFAPWWFIGCSKERDFLRTFRLNGLTGRMDEVRKYRFIDGPHRETLEGVPEYRVMSSLSPAYHLVKAEPDGDGFRLVCRDLRTRHFGARFGELTLAVDGSGAVREKRFRA